MNKLDCSATSSSSSGIQQQALTCALQDSHVPAPPTLTLLPEVALLNRDEQDQVQQQTLFDRSEETNKYVTLSSTASASCSNENDLSSNYLNGPIQPVVTYPKSLFGNRMRSFSVDWFRKYPLLEYSVSGDSVFCFVCRHFPPQTRMNVNDSNCFANGGLRDWKNVDQKLSKHFNSASHDDAVKQLTAKKQAEKAGSVVTQLFTGFHKFVEQNRKTVQTLLRIALFCARQGIGLRGHKETVTDNSNEKTRIHSDNKDNAEIESLNQAMTAKRSDGDSNKGNFLGIS